MKTKKMGVLREIFEPSKEEIWQQVSNGVNTRFGKDGIFRTDVLKFKTGQWSMTLETYESGGEYSITRTKIRAPFVNKDELKFQLFEESIFNSIDKCLGFRNIEIEDKIFDKQFKILGNNEEKVRVFLRDERLKRLIKERRNLQLCVRDSGEWFKPDFPDGVDELFLKSLGIIKDVNQIKDLFELFSTALERLVTMDSAYKKNPRVRLA